MRFLPFGRKWLLFTADNGVSVVMYRSIAERMRGDPRVRQFHAMHFRRIRRVDRDDREDPKGFFAKFGIHEGVTHYKVARNLPVDVLVAPNFNDRLHDRWARVKVQIFHGVSFKNYCIKPKAQRYDRLFLPGPYHRRRYVESGLFASDDPRLAVIGLPKLDRLVDGSIDRDRVLLDLGLDPARKTVLFAPTGDAGNALNRMGEEIIAEVLKLPVNLIVKPHDHADPDEACPVDWRARLPQTRHERFRADIGSDVVPLLAAADLLITDASSVAFEYTVLDRPIVYIHVPEILEGPRSAQFDLETHGRKGGEIVHRPAELLEVVPRLLENPRDRSEVRRAIARDLFLEPGTATERAVAALYDLLQLEPPAKAARPARAGTAAAVG